MKIVVKNINKSFDKKHVLHNVSISINDGQFVGILGPNGAGKSTLMKIIVNQISPDNGNVIWKDNNHVLSRYNRANLIGFVHQRHMLDDFLTVKENLVFRGSLKNMTKEQVLNKINDLNHFITIKSLLKTKYVNLSGGQKRTVDIISALLHSPKLLILDEPTTGLDPQVRSELWSFINKIRIKKHLSIILVTHYLEEMRNIDKLIVLIKGNVRYQGNINKFVKKYSSNFIELKLYNDKNVIVTKFIHYKSLSDKIRIIDDAYSNKELVDFKDYPISLNRAYLNMINNKLIR